MVTELVPRGQLGGDVRETVTYVMTSAGALRAIVRHPDSERPGLVIPEHCRARGGKLPCAGKLTRCSRRVAVQATEHCRVAELLTRYHAVNHPRSGNSPPALAKA